MEIKIKDRSNDELLIKKESKSTLFLYNNFLGRIVLKVLVLPSISKIVGSFMNSKLSKFMIKKTIKEGNIDLDEYIADKWNSYNDFFTRKIKDNKRTIDMNKDTFISPCDSKLQVYTINKDNVLKIKNSYYKISTLVGRTEEDFENGYALVFRLETTDYHRYCFIDNGINKDEIFIKGYLHTVRNVALDKYKVFSENSRVVSSLKTENFGDIVQIEVGAMMVGKIINHKKNSFSKGEEKGYFMFGGSTIVLLVRKDKLLIDEDILNNSHDNIETVVKYGEKIGFKL